MKYYFFRINNLLKSQKMTFKMLINRSMVLVTKVPLYC